MEENNEYMQVVILLNKDIESITHDKVKVIRIKDKKYNLLIMKDYWPVIGELDGDIYFDGDESFSYEGIKGFYVLSHDVFRLIIVEEKSEE